MWYSPDSQFANREFEVTECDIKLKNYYKLNLNKHYYGNNSKIRCIKNEK